MLRRPWFRGMDEEFRAMSNLYPWFCIWSSFTRSSFFENREGRDDGTKFAYDQAKWSVIALCTLEEEGVDLTSYPSLQGALNVSEEDIQIFGRRSRMSEVLNTQKNNLFAASQERDLNTLEEVQLWMANKAVSLLKSVSLGETTEQIRIKYKIKTEKVTPSLKPNIQVNYKMQLRYCCKVE